MARWIFSTPRSRSTSVHFSPSSSPRRRPVARSRYKPIHDELKKLQNGWTNKRDKYEEAHRAELTLWNAASRYLHANLPKGTKTLPIAEWEQEYADLKTQRDSDYTKLKDTRTNVSELQKIRKCVDIALRADQPEQTQSRTKRHDIDR